MAKKFATSYTRQALYEKCAFQYKCRFILKLPEEERYASQRGTLLHSKAEHFILGDITGVPKELEVYSEELITLREGLMTGTLSVEVEKDLAVTRGWGPTTYDDWNNVWIRAKADVVIDEGDSVTVIDHKTGMMYDSHKDQADIYSILAFCHYPKAKEVSVEMWYYDNKDLFLSSSMTKKQLPKAKKLLKGRIDKAEKDKVFKPTPGDYCRYCSFASSKGGPCKKY